MPQPAGGDGGGGILRGRLKEYDDVLEAMAKEKDARDDTIEGLKEEIKTRKAAGQSVVNLERELKKETEIRETLTKTMKKLEDARQKEIDNLDKVKKGLSGLHGAVSTTVKDYYSYNLALQKAIDQTGRFGGKAEQARRDFERLRTDLNLTTKAAGDFFQTWTEAMQLGVTNSQLKEMVRHLQSIRGQTEGIAAAKQIMATPMTAELRTRVAGGDRAALIRAMRTAQGPEQRQALIDMARSRPGTPVAERAVAFEMTGARLEKLGEDIKMGMAAFVDKGIGPDIAAALVPLTGIFDNTRKTYEGIQALIAVTTSRGVAGVLGGGAGLAGRIFGTGAGIGGTALTAGKLLKGGLFGAAGELGKAGFDLGAGELEKRGLSTGAKWARVGGMAARGAGMGAMIGSIIPGLGTGVGAGVGAAIGGGVGIAQQFGDVIVKKFKEWTPEWVKGFDKVATREEVLADVMASEAASGERVAKNLEGLNKTIQTLPEAIEAAMAERAVRIGKESVDRGAFATGLDVIETKIGAALDTTIESSNNELKRLDGEKKAALEKLNKAGMGPESAEYRDMAKKFDQLISPVVLNLQQQIDEADTGRTGREAMERLETRRGQIGQERAAVTARFQLTGAVTGNRADIERFRRDTAEVYKKDIAAIRVESRDAKARVAGMMANLRERLKVKDLDARTRKSLEETLQARSDQLRLIDKNAEVMELTAEAEQRSANINAMLEQSTAFEKTAVYRRAQQTQALARAQEELLRERGATPQEIGGVTRQQAVSATAMLGKFMETFDENLAGWNDMMKAARATGDEATMVLAEQEIFKLRQKGVELERNALTARIRAATAEEQERRDQLGVQKSMLETIRDSAARTGASWRVQMGYQAAIIATSREELESAKRAFIAAKEAGETGLPLLKRQLEVVQKDAALREATLGKQRDFLEKAIASSFGMGGGTRALPNINPRIFGQLVKNQLGQLMPGAPMTIAQTRQAMGGNIFGGIGGGGFRIGPAPVRPGINPAEFVGPPAPPGMGNQAAAGAGPGAVPGAVDVSGKVAVAVSFDTEMFRSEVAQIAVRAVRNDNKQGAVG